MKGVYNRNGNLFASWKREGKTRRYSLLLNEKGTALLSPKKTLSIAENMAQIFKSLDYGELGKAQGEAAIKAIPKLPPNVVSNALKLVDALAWDKDADKLSIRDYFTNFQGRAGEKLERCRSTAIKRFLAFLGDEADKPLDSLTKAQCEECIISELNRVALGTVKQFRRLIAHPLNEAVEDGLLSRNPISRVNVEKLNLSINPDFKKEVSRVPFTVDDIKKLDEHLPQDWHDAMLICLLTGGQRLGDVMCLKWDSVNFDEGKNGVIRFSTNKSNGNISIIAPMLPKLRARLLELRENIINYPDGQEYVLPYQAHLYLNNKGNLSTSFTNLLKALGIEEVKSNEVLKGDRRITSKKSFHSFRHFTSGILEAAEGVSGDLQRAIVGHASKDVHSGYIAFDEQRRIHALESIAKAIGWL